MNGKEWENVRKNDKERKKCIIYEQEEQVKEERKRSRRYKVVGESKERKDGGRKEWENGRKNERNNSGELRERPKTGRKAKRRKQEKEEEEWVAEDGDGGEERE